MAATPSSEKLEVGDRIRLSGGYDPVPSWLGDNPHFDGHVAEFIPGQNVEPAAVIRLHETIVVAESSGDILVLELRYAGAKWGSTGTVHVELCDFVPERVQWKGRRQGKWVESHATYRRISDSAE